MGSLQECREPQSRGLIAEHHAVAAQWSKRRPHSHSSPPRFPQPTPKPCGQGACSLTHPPGPRPRRVSLALCSKATWAKAEQSSAFWGSLSLRLPSAHAAASFIGWAAARRGLISHLSLKLAEPQGGSNELCLLGMQLLGALSGGVLKELRWSMRSSADGPAGAGSLQLGFGAPVQLPRLRRLALRCAGQEIITVLGPGFAALTRLTRLALAGIGVLVWEGGCLPSSLKELEVDSHGAMPRLDPLEGLPALERLVLGFEDLPVNSSVHERLRPISRLTQLTRLGLHNPGLRLLPPDFPIWSSPNLKARRLGAVLG